jgi:hypothetical protein
MEDITLELLRLETQKLCDNLKSCEPRIFEELIKTTQDFEKAIDVLNTLNNVLKHTSNKEERSTLSMAMFFWQFEGLYVCRLDFFCLLLVASGHDLFNLIRRKYVSSIDEIGEVDLSTKFKFLDVHKLKMLNREEDQRIRNKIAHHDFSLDDKGNILVDGEIADFVSKIHDLNEFVSKITNILIECLGKSK